MASCLHLQSLVRVSDGSALSDRLNGYRTPSSAKGPGFSQDAFLVELDRVHLTWFAAEDEGRTEDPTEQKIRKSREEGKVAKSQDVTSGIMLVLSVGALWILSEYLLRGMQEMTAFFVGNAVRIDITKDNTVVRAFFSFFVRLALPLALVGFVAAAVGNIVQVGFLFTTKPIEPDLNKIAPKFGQFVKRSILSAEAAFNLFKALGKVLIIGLIAFLNIRGNIDRFVHLINVPFRYGVAQVASVTLAVLFQSALVLLVLSLFDYLFQRKQHRESLKMTKQEVKEERKQYEGDPLVKSRLRRRMREILSTNMARSVAESDVVVTNPTHYSIALRYDQEAMNAPVVTAKGVDEIALRIRVIAREHDVPLVENRPLARSLYADVEIGDEIPEMYYRAVSTVIAQVLKMRGETDG